MTILRSYLFSLLLRAYAVAALSLGGLLWLLSMLNGLENGVTNAADLALLVLSALQGVPEGLIDLLPVITVLATAAAMSGLQARSELTILRASGLSVWRLTGIVMVPGILAALLGLAALQWVTPMIQQGPERMMGASLGENGLWHPWHGLWVRQDEDFLNVQSLHLGRIPTGINLYRFDDQGAMQEHIQADEALVMPDGTWRMEGVTQRRFNDQAPRQLERLPEFNWDAFLSARQLELLLSPPASLALSDLWQYVQGLKQRNQESAEFEMILWRRLALPLACIGMVLAAMATSAVPLKSRAASVRIVGALTLGLGFQLLAELTSYAGLVLSLPVIPVAMGPPILLLLVAWWLLRKAR